MVTLRQHLSKKKKYASEILAAEPNGIMTQQVLVLQNLTHPFTKPNVLDIKLGTVLYDENATTEKRTRMEKSAQNTTSLEMGMRLTGFNVSEPSPGPITAHCQITKP